MRKLDVYQALDRLKAAFRVNAMRSGYYQGHEHFDAFCDAVIVGDDAKLSELATAPSRASDGGVTREEIAKLVDPRSFDPAVRDSCAKTANAKVAFDIADAILARLAASHAGDRERLRGLVDDLARREVACREIIASGCDEVAAGRVSAKATAFNIAYRLTSELLAPAAGQDDAGKAQS